MRNRVVNLTIALVAGIVLATASVPALTAWREHQVAQHEEQARGGPSEPRDRVLNAVDGVREDGVHVTPDGRHMLDEDGEQRLAEALVGLDTPVRVIVWRKTNGAGAYLDTGRQLEEAFADERSVLVVWEGPETGDVILTGGQGSVRFHSSDFVGDPATTIIGALDDLSSPSWRDENSSGDNDYWGGVVGGIGAGVMLGGFGILALWGLARLVRALSGGTLRLPGGWK